MSGERTSAYLAYDEHGALLYVGITGSGVRRLHQHRKYGEWWPHVVSINVEHFPTADEARQRERDLLINHRPPYNTAIPTGEQARKNSSAPSKPSYRHRVKELTESGLTPREIATLLHVSTQAVYKHMARLGIDPPTRRDGVDAA